MRRAAAAQAQAVRAKSGTWGEGTLAQATSLVHAGVSPDEKSGAILTPLYLSTTFTQESVEKYLAKGYSYSRTNNPTISTGQEARHPRERRRRQRLRHRHGCDYLGH